MTEFATTAKVAAADAKESQKLTAAALADAQTKLAEITSAATQAVAAMTQITDYQAVIVTKSEHIQDAQEHADKVRADLDRVLTAATQQATEAEGEKSRAQSAADTAATVLADVRTAKGSAETDAAALAKALKTAEESTVLTKGLAEKSSVVEENIAAYEKRPSELVTECAAQLKNIVDLLPGATTAGLAHSFNARRETFLKPHNRWQWVFVGSVLALVTLAVTGLLQVYLAGKIPEWDELLRLWLSRLPVAGALVWLALHASRESALAKRLEEDYGYKSAIAACFLGFQKQLSEMQGGLSPDSPLAKLCGNTLATIAAPPGRIYESHKLTISPTDELKQAAKATVDVATAVKPPVK